MFVHVGHTGCKEPPIQITSNIEGHAEVEDTERVLVTKWMWGGGRSPSLTEVLSLLFSAGVSFSLEALAVSEGAGCVLEELPWDVLFPVSVLVSASASC